jgi:aminotransferase
MKENINIGSGDPDFEAPQKVVESAVKTLKEGGRWTHYSHIRRNPTQDNFLEAVVDYYKGLGPTYELEQVIPTAGSGAALSIAMATLLEKGDEILMFEPAFMGYFGNLKALGVKPVLAPLNEARGFHPDMETLGEYVTPKTKAILLCSPNNPTGTVYTPEETKGIAEVAIEHDLGVIADEIYLHYIFDDNVFTSISSLEGMKERTINVMSFSKTFSMTGWRLGYALVPDPLLEKAKEKAGLNSAIPATFVHAAGAVALRECWDYVDQLREEYLKRRNYFCDAVNRIDGLSCSRPEGGFYAWVKISGTGLGSKKFVEHLAEKENLTLTPGFIFGGKRDDYVRIALVRPLPVLEQAVDRLKRFVESL